MFMPHSKKLHRNRSMPQIHNAKKSERQAGEGYVMQLEDGALKIPDFNFVDVLNKSKQLQLKPKSFK